MNGSIIKEVITPQKGVKETPEPAYFVDELGESAVVICCRYWIDTNEYWDVVRTTVKSVKREFAGAGISIPFPQVTWHGAPPKIVIPPAPLR